jgi:hypothetical protein
MTRMQHEVFRSEEQQLRLYAPVFVRLPDGEVEARTLIVTDTTMYLCTEAFDMTEAWVPHHGVQGVLGGALFHPRARFSMPYQLPLASLSRVIVTEGTFSTGECKSQESILLGFGQRKLFSAHDRSHTRTHKHTRAHLHTHTYTHLCMQTLAYTRIHKHMQANPHTRARLPRDFAEWELLCVAGTWSRSKAVLRVSSSRAVPF